MIKRPKNTDTMDDVLKMQEEFLKDKKKEKPAAEIVKCSRKSESKKLEKNDVSEKKMKIENAVLGEIVERKQSAIPEKMEIDGENNLSSDDRGFPKPPPINTRSFESKPNQKSIFSQMMSRKRAGGSSSGNSKNASKPVVLQNASSDSSKDDSRNIHEENLKTLNQMSEAEILEEQQKLISSMDPKLLEFIKSRKSAPSVVPKSTEPPNPQPSNILNEEVPALDFLKNDSAKNWLHFDIFEPEKLEWTKDIEQTFSNLKKGETFEARFDWKGFLLPYIENKDDNKKIVDDRELYLHGEDPHRPGYTLQELFRLARSNVLQQRISALNAIAGILNIYNQGCYDDILEIPVSKIFFFLRFAIDENIPAIVEAASKGLANLFYNNTDETLLDIAYETTRGVFQPTLDRINMDSDNNEELLESLENLSLDGKKHKLFESNLEDLKDDIDSDKDDMSDFHLAEVNLMECLVRTDIIERISYILTIMEPNEATVLNCVKILIRIARTKREFALKIVMKSNLLDCLISKYLPEKLSVNDTAAHFIIMKLLRVLACYDVSFCVNLKKLNIQQVAKTFLCTRSDINISLLKLQIEVCRFLRIYLSMIPDEALFGELVSSIRYLMEWHYQFLSYDEENHFIIRQHAASLLNLLSIGNMALIYPYFSEIFQLCLCKWFVLATKSNSIEFSQKILLSALLNAAVQFINFASEYFFDFIDNYLVKFMKSSIYQKLSNISESSPLFKNCYDRSGVYQPLPNLGAIIRINNVPTLIFNQDYSVHFMKSLLNFIENLNNMRNIKNQQFYMKLKLLYFNHEIIGYLEKFSNNHNRKLRCNWFMKTEIAYIYDLITIENEMLDSYILKIAFNLLNCLSQDNVNITLKIFDQIIFNPKYYQHDYKNEDFKKWKYIYNGIVVSKLKTSNDYKYFATHNWTQHILDENWPYSLLLILLYNIETSTDKRKIVETELSEEDLILTSLKFSNLLEQNKIKVVSNNQTLMYLMLVYFGKNSNFLDAEVQKEVEKRLITLRGTNFNFNVKLNKERSFESLFTIFLDVFQSSSYGDKLFSTIVMIPLAQKYHNKWRKLVWSEYVMAMKFISCQENELFYDIKEYLNPVETDESILKSYSHAISTNILRQNTIPYKIATHHLALSLEKDKNKPVQTQMDLS